jgi:hypothetical protein
MIELGSFWQNEAKFTNAIKGAGNALANLGLADLGEGVGF